MFNSAGCVGEPGATRGRERDPRDRSPLAVGQWQRWAQGLDPQDSTLIRLKPWRPNESDRPPAKGVDGCAASPAVSGRSRVKLRGAQEPPIRLQHQPPGGWERISAGLAGETPGSIRGVRTSTALARSASAPMAGSAQALQWLGAHPCGMGLAHLSTPGIRSGSARHTWQAPAPGSMDAARAACC